MAEPSREEREPPVELSVVTDAHLVLFREWFIAARPETQTCQPVKLLSPEETVTSYRGKDPVLLAQDFAIIRVRDRQLVGRIRYFNVNPRNRSAEIGYMIGPEFQGRGYATAAMGLMLELLFGPEALNKVHAQTAEFNRASVALLKRWGFHEDARLRQHHELDGVLYDDLVFSLLAEEYLGCPTS